MPQEDLNLGNLQLGLSQGNIIFLVYISRMSWACRQRPRNKRQLKGGSFDTGEMNQVVWPAAEIQVGSHGFCLSHNKRWSSLSLLADSPRCEICSPCQGGFAPRNLPVLSHKKAARFAFLMLCGLIALPRKSSPLLKKETGHYSSGTGCSAAGTGERVPDPISLF